MKTNKKMRHTKKSNKWYCLLMAGIAATSLTLNSCEDEGAPDKIIPEQYLIVPEHEMNIGTDESFIVNATCSSTWSVSTNASWITFKNNLSWGDTGILCYASANRTESARSAYVYIKTYFRNNEKTDSILITQEVNNSPILEASFADGSALEEQKVSADGGSFDLSIQYNYGVATRVDYTDQAEEDWVKITSTPAELPVCGKEPGEATIHVAVTENLIVAERTAEVRIYSTQDESIYKTFKIVQNKAIELAPAVTAFKDDFSYCKSHTAQFAGEGWIVGGVISIFKQFNNTFQALLVNGSGTGYAIMPAFNVKEMKNKVMNYKWAPGNTNAITTADDKLEIVWSTDYRDDISKATWHVLADVTNKDTAPKIGIPKAHDPIDLSPLAAYTRVYIGFRYADLSGATTAYRIDDIAVGDVE